MTACFAFIWVGWWKEPSCYLNIPPGAIGLLLQQKDKGSPRDFIFYKGRKIKKRGYSSLTNLTELTFRTGSRIAYAGLFDGVGIEYLLNGHTPMIIFSNFVE